MADEAATNEPTKKEETETSHVVDDKVKPPEVNVTPPPSVFTNRYTTKQTITQGLQLIALLVANAAQLHFIVRVGNTEHDYYNALIGIISGSFFLQVVCGFLMVYLGFANIDKVSQQNDIAHISTYLGYAVLLLVLLNFQDGISLENKEEADGAKKVWTKSKTKDKKNRKIFNMKTYIRKKTLLQGVLDVALLAENAAQLKYFLRFGEEHEFYSVVMHLLVTCITLLGLSGLLILFIMLIDIDNPKSQKFIRYVNDAVAVGLSLGVIFHIMISAFSIKITSDFYYRNQTNHFAPIETMEDILKKMERDGAAAAMIPHRSRP